MENVDRHIVSRSYCLALIPNRPDLNIVFDHALQPVIEDSKHTCTRANDLFDGSNSLEDTKQNLQQANVILADLTGQDPSVVLGLGWALASGKNIIVISQNSEDVPDDIQDSVTFIPYSFSQTGAQRLQNDLRNALSFQVGSSFSHREERDYHQTPHHHQYSQPRTIIYEELRGGDPIKGTVVSTGPLFAVIQDTKKRCFRLYNTDVSWFYKEENMAYQFSEGTAIESVYTGEDNHGNLKVSLKSEEENPWPELTETYSLGDPATGKVIFRDARRYGIRLDDTDAIGLLLFSECKGEEYNEGNEVEALVRAISEDTGIVLGIGSDPWDQIDFSEGEVIEGKVVKVLPYGLLIELAPGTVGLWHASNGCMEPDTYVEEQVVEIKIKEIDRTRRKIYLCNFDEL